MNKMSRIALYSSAVLFAVLVLPGCGKFTDMMKKKEEGKETAKEGAVLCSISSKPVIFEGDFNKRLRETLDQNPFSRGVPTDVVSMQEKRRFLDNLVNDELLLIDANKTNAEADPEFIKAFKEICDLLKRNMKIEFMKKKIYEGIKTSETDVKNFYNESKEHFVKVEGGTLAVGIKFDKDASANAFLVKAKANVNGFEAMAKATKEGQFTEFGRIGKESKKFALPIVPQQVRDRILTMTTFPAIAKVQAGKDIWVIKAIDKKDAVYKDIKEAEKQIEGMLKSKKFSEEAKKYIERLKSENPINVNEAYFQTKDAVKPAQGEKPVQEEKHEHEDDHHEHDEATAPAAA